MCLNTLCRNFVFRSKPMARSWFVDRGVGHLARQPVVPTLELCWETDMLPAVVSRMDNVVKAC